MLSVAHTERRGRWAAGMVARIKATDPENQPSHQEIAEAAGVSRTVVSHWCDGSDPVEPWHVEGLIAAFGCAVVMGVEELPRGGAGDPLEPIAECVDRAAALLVGHRAGADAESQIAVARQLVAAAGRVEGCEAHRARRGGR